MATNETGKAAAKRYRMVSRRISDAVEFAVIARGDRVRKGVTIRNDSQIRSG